MDYCETRPPPALDGLVAAVWTLDVAGDEWVEHEAIPDGCVELIRRHAGQSVWRTDQPPLFATGLALRPARLRFSGDARFTGIRFWPWAWHALNAPHCSSFTDGWVELAEDRPWTQLLPDDSDPMPRLTAAFDGIAPPAIAAIRHLESIAALAMATGLAPRQLQRLFARETGMPPRSYLRLVRFREAVAEVQAPDARLAETAAATGYADQAHLTREFRALGGITPAAARRTARGPFMPGGGKAVDG